MLTPVLRRLRHRRSTLQRTETGVVAIEFMVVISMLIVVFLVMLQYAVRAHAQRIADAAAQQGLAAAAQYDGTAAKGQRTAEDYLTRLGPGLTHTSVQASRNATTATITLHGRVEPFIPFLPVVVRVQVQAPVERFVPPSAGGTP